MPEAQFPRSPRTGNWFPRISLLRLSEKGFEQRLDRDLAGIRSRDDPKKKLLVSLGNHGIGRLQGFSDSLSRILGE